MTRSGLLALDNDIIVQHIFHHSNGWTRQDLLAAACTCRRMCSVVRLSVAALSLEEDEAQEISKWPTDCTFSRARGVQYYAQESLPALPGLSGLIPHAAQCWTSLSELALVVEADAQPLAHRAANNVILQQLPRLTALHSLRHLQLYKTAPFTSDAAQLAQLTQLTSLMLHDASYMPGQAALVCVNLQPLSTLTNLQSIAISGICPAAAAGARQEARTREERAASRGAVTAATAAAGATGSSSRSGGSSSGSAACLPSSLTSLVLKAFDAAAIDMWMPHVVPLTSLKALHVMDFGQRHGPSFEAFPAPLLDSLAHHHLPNLTELRFGLPTPDNHRMNRGYVAISCRLPRNISSLQQLRALSTSWCQLSLQSSEDYASLAALSNLTCQEWLDALCAPPPNLQFPNVRQLALLNTPTSAPIYEWSFASGCPKLDGLGVGTHRAQDWQAVCPRIAECSALVALALEFSHTLDLAGAAALKQLGLSLPVLKQLGVTWSGAYAAGSQLPPFGNFQGLEQLSLYLCEPGRQAPWGFQPDLIGDAQLLAYLAPLTKLKVLTLIHFHDITPAVVLGLQALMPQLQQVVLTNCRRIVLEEDGEASWEGSNMQLVRAALRPGFLLHVFHRHVDMKRQLGYDELPFEVRYLSAHFAG